jgi:hypothetical protein
LIAQGFVFVGAARERRHTLRISSSRAGATEAKNKLGTRHLACGEVLGSVFKLPTEQLESISRQVPRKKRTNSGAYFEHFCGEPGVKAAEMRPSGV